MVIVWRVRGKIIKSVLCRIVYNNCAQCNAHTCEQTCWLDLAFLWLYCVLQFICVRFSFLGLLFSSKLGISRILEILYNVFWRCSCIWL